jgi:type IV secretory pathway TraG/TraD family ATPase VirD4
MNIHDILDSIGDALNGLLLQLVGNKHRYNGKLGNPRKVLKYKHRKGNGLRIGQKYISIRDTLNGGMLLIGKTGSGKSSKIYLKNLFGASKMVDTSFVVTDMTGELRDISMLYMEQELDYGEDVLNFANAKESSAEWNPIENLPLDRVNRFSSELVAIEGGDSSREPIWANTSSAIISMMILLLKTIEPIIGTNRYTNLYNIRYLVTLIQAEVKKMNVLVSQFADEMLFTSYKALIQNDSKFLNSALSNTLSILKNWEDENVIKTTSRTTLDMSAYRNEKRILWLQSSVMAQQTLSGLNSLFLKEWFTQLMESGIPAPDDNTLAFLVDEAGALRTSDKGFIPFISSQIRKYRAYGIWGYQSYSQCVELYGKEGAQTLKNNTGTVLYLGGQDLDTATVISRSLGKYSFTKNERVQHREVMTPTEVMHQSSKDGGMLICNGQPPMPLKRIRAYYENRRFKKWAEQPAPPIDISVSEMPPLLPIDELIGSITVELESNA